MRNLIYTPLLVFLVAMIIACSPKVITQTTTETSAPPTKVETPMTDCDTWLGKPNQSGAEDAHVLYRDAIRAGKMEEAFPLWETAYRIGPAADGQRDFHFTDGAKLYAHKLSKATNEAEKKRYIAKIEAIYEEGAKCYPENASKYFGLLGFDQYYKYEGLVDKSTVYNTFKKSIDMRGDSAHYFTVNPFTAVMIDMLIAKDIPMAEGQKYAKVIMNSIAYGKANCKNARACEPWEIIEDYAPLRLADLEGIEGFYDCDYYKENYFDGFDQSSDDCEEIQLVYGRLKWGGCTDADPAFQKIKSIRDTKCAPEPIVETEVNNPYRDGIDCLREANYNCAVEKLQQAIQESTKPNNQAKYALLIAKVYYAHLKNFPESRKWALESAQYDPTDGAPYILIGKLYASSGPLCGPGRGWDSQIVTWPAIDKWQKAKSVDSSVASEANKLINRYLQYMPDGVEIFQRGLQEGGPFKVRCWIQENTTIRKAP